VFSTSSYLWAMFSPHSQQIGSWSSASACNNSNPGSISCSILTPVEGRTRLAPIALVRQGEYSTTLPFPRREVNSCAKIYPKSLNWADCESRSKKNIRPERGDRHTIVFEYSNTLSIQILCLSLHTNTTLQVRTC
jgi:hypothetical protein